MLSQSRATLIWEGQAKIIISTCVYLLFVFIESRRLMESQQQKFAIHSAEIKKTAASIQTAQVKDIPECT